jgi:proline iminopeptidase
MKKIIPILITITVCCFVSCKEAPAPVCSTLSTMTDDVQSGGIKMIPIETPVGKFKVWTKNFGDNPRIKVLLLHGGL